MLEAIQNAIAFNELFDQNEDREEIGNTTEMIKDLKRLIETLECNS